MASSTSRPHAHLLLLSTAIFTVVYSSYAAPNSGFIAPIRIASLHDHHHHLLQNHDLSDQPEGIFFPFESNLYIQIAIGTPLRAFNLKLDSSTHLTWLECEPCDQCFLSDPHRRYDGKSSNTFSAIPCNASVSSPCSPTTTNDHYHHHEVASSSPFLFCFPSGFCGYDAVSADDSTSSSGDIVSDTLHLLSSISDQDNTLPLHGFVFGCGTRNTVRREDNGVGVDGRTSLTTHPFSLLSQLRVTRFSHCIWDSSAGPRNYLRFGSAAEYGGGEMVKVAMLNVTGSHLFHVSLLGISVGLQRMRSSHERSIAIDIGTYFTRLDAATYEEVRQELLLQIGPRIAYQLNQLMCFSRRHDVDENVDSLPRITLRFEHFNFTISNKAVYLRDGLSLCAAIVPTSSEDGDRNVLGASALIDHVVAYDVSEHKIAFQPKDCLADFVDGM